MNFKQSFILAIKSLSASKMRSFLTMLGIIIGIAAVIVLVSMVNGMKNEIVEQFQSMGTNLLTVRITGRGSSRSIGPDDMLKLAEDNPDVFIGCSPSVSMMSATIKMGNDNISTSVTGVSETYADIRNLTVETGRFLEYVDVDKKQHVCVIGTYIAKELFNSLTPIGETIKINNSVYRIVGVLEEKAKSESGSADDVIYIPYTTASRYARINTYYFSTTDETTIDKGIDIIGDKLFKVFANENLYSISSLDEMINMIGDLTGKMTLILVGVAGISLLVGGIGIMNIMLVSVTERTREIGIRKSLGAKQRDIMSQFVVEAATTSVIGGIIGIILGIGAAFGAAKLMGMTAAPSLNAVAIAFTVSAAIGVAFGYFPAKKAARLNPIEALRYD